MTNATPAPAPKPTESTEEVAFFAKARKAFAAGGVALVGSVGGELPGIFAAVGNHTVNAALIWGDAGIVVGAVVVAFSAVYRVANAS